MPFPVHCGLGHKPIVFGSKNNWGNAENHLATYFCPNVKHEVLRVFPFGIYPEPRNFVSLDNNPISFQVSGSFFRNDHIYFSKVSPP